MGKARSHPIAVIEINPEHGGRIRELNNNDVLCGRGGRVNAYHGNIQFRLLVCEHKHLYLAKTVKKLDKAHIAARVVSKIRQLNPPGRFLKEDETRRLWIEIGDVKARKKTGQALREDTHDLMNKSNGKESPISIPVACDAPDLVNKSDEKDSYISSPMERSPSGMLTGPLQWDRPCHPLQQLDAIMGNHHTFPNITNRVRRIPISERSTVGNGYNTSPRQVMPYFANQHMNQDKYYANSDPVPAYCPTYTPVRMNTNDKLQSELAPHQCLQQNPHHIVSILDTCKNQDYRTCQTDSTSNADFDSRILSRMENIIASQKILNYRSEPKNNDQNKSFTVRAERRKKFQRPIWKNGKSTEFPHMKEVMSEDNFNVALSWTANEDVPDSKRSRIAQFGSYNGIFNSSVTSSCFQNSNISCLRTSLGVSGLTLPSSVPPNAMSLTDADFSTIVEDMLCADESIGYTSSFLSNKRSANIGSFVN